MNLFRFVHLKKNCPAVDILMIQEAEDITTQLSQYFKDVFIDISYNLKKIYQISTDSSPPTDQALIQTADILFSYVVKTFKKQSPQSRRLIYNIIYNYADTTVIPSFILDELSNVQSAKEAALFIDIAIQLRSPFGIDFAINLFQNSIDRSDFGIIAASLIQLINYVPEYSITEAFILYLPFFRQKDCQYVIENQCLDRQIIVEMITPEFYGNPLGLKICFFYDIEPAAEQLARLIDSSNIKIQKYIYKLICKFQMAELENEAIILLNNLLSDYRLSSLEKMDITLMARDSELKKLQSAYMQLM